MCETKMSWAQVAFCKYEAIGEKGNFLIWKADGVWKGVYRSKNKQHTTVFVSKKSLKEMKQVCENSVYWE